MRDPLAEAEPSLRAPACAGSAFSPSPSSSSRTAAGLRGDPALRRRERRPRPPRRQPARREPPSRDLPAERRHRRHRPSRRRRPRARPPSRLGRDPARRDHRAERPGARPLAGARRSPPARSPASRSRSRACAPSRNACSRSSPTPEAAAARRSARSRSTAAPRCGAALEEDLCRARGLLAEALPAGDAETVAYCAQFVGSVGEMLGDRDLAAAARRATGPGGARLLAAALAARIEARGVGRVAAG